MASIIFINLNGEKLDIVDFYIKSIPSPFAQVGGNTKGAISKDFFDNKFGVILTIVNFGWDVRFKNLGFEIILESKEKLITMHNTGPLFSKEAKELFRQVKLGDKIKFTNILSETPVGDTITIEPIEFYISEQ